MPLKRLFNRVWLGPIVDRPGLEGETYLTRAVKNGDVSAVREFLTIGANPDTKNRAGETPLYLAMVARNLPVFHLLIETGADILARQNGMTLREHAEKRNMAGIAEFLHRLEIRKQEEALAASVILPVGVTGVLAASPFLIRKLAERGRGSGQKNEEPQKKRPKPPGPDNRK